MRFGPSVFLGLAVTDRAITCAEVAVGGEQRTVRRVASFPLEGGHGWDKPDAAGQALAGFLRKMRFTASRAVVGIPAKWVVAQERELPPSDAEQARAILRLQAERLAVAAQGEMVFDYAGEPDAARPSRVLLIAMQRQRLETLEKLLDAAGISLVAVTATSLALARAVGSAGSDQPLVMLGRQGVELVWHAAGAPQMLRHVGAVQSNGHAGASIAPLGAELRRMVALAPAGGNGTGREVLLLDGIGLDGEQIEQLSQRLGLPVRASRGIDELGAAALPDAAAAGIGQYAPAVSLALAAARRQSLAVDFHRSRLAPPRQRRLGRRTTALIALGIVAAVALASLYLAVRQRENRLAQLQTDLATMAPDVTNAEQVVRRVNFANGFFDARPPALECLREVTLAFRDDEQIWATSFTYRDNGKSQLNGKAMDPKTVLAVLDRLQKNPRLKDVKSIEMREAGGKTREWTFQLSFTFVP